MATVSRAADLDKWLKAAREAHCSRVEVLAPKGTVLASLALDDGLVSGERLLDVARDDAAGMFGRVTYRARVYDGDSYREERKLTIEGGAPSEEDATDGPPGQTTERGVVGQLSRLCETLVREVRGMVKSTNDTLASMRDAENETRRQWGDILHTQLELAQLKSQEQANLLEIDRKRERDRLFAQQFGPGVRALVGYLTSGKAVPVDDSVRKLITSLLQDEDRAARVFALLKPHEQAELQAIAQGIAAVEAAEKQKTPPEDSVGQAAPPEAAP